MIRPWNLLLIPLFSSSHFKRFSGSPSHSGNCSYWATAIALGLCWLLCHSSWVLGNGDETTVMQQQPQDLSLKVKTWYVNKIQSKLNETVISLWYAHRLKLNNLIFWEKIKVPGVQTTVWKSYGHFGELWLFSDSWCVSFCCCLLWVCVFYSSDLSVESWVSN